MEKYSGIPKEVCRDCSALLQMLGKTQTLLALIINDPENPDNGHKAAVQFNYNKAVIAKIKARKP